MCCAALQEELAAAKASSGASEQLQQMVQEQAATISSLQVSCCAHCWSCVKKELVLAKDESGRGRGLPAVEQVSACCSCRPK